MNIVLEKRIAFPHEMIFFLAVWFFASAWYGEVFTMAREYSFFAFDKLLMHPVLHQSGGALWWSGRGFLCLFAHPWLGGLALALILTLASRITGRLLRLPSQWDAMQYLPATAYLFYFTTQGFDAFVYREPGRIIGIPLGYLLLTGALYALSVAFARPGRPAGIPDRQHKPGRHPGYRTAMATALLLPVCIGFYGTYYRPYMRTTAILQHYMRQQKWEEMVETAQTYEGSNRMVAAYHAIALHHTGRLLEDLFKIRYDFDPVAMTSRNGQPTNGRDLYEADCNFHAGLLQTAYRKDMEHTVLDGICTSRLKRMVLYAVAKDEPNLALRYLHVLSHQPFEKPFVQKYRRMAQTPGAAAHDPLLSFVNQCAPASDVFEGFLTEPAFVGYYAALKQPANKAQLDAVMAATLYTKMMSFFLYHASTYPTDGTWPAAVGDALGMAYAYKQIPGNPPESLIPYANRFRAFVQNINQPGTSTPSDPGHKLFEQYRGYYPYYYFFGNRDMGLNPSPNPQEQGGVN